MSTDVQVDWANRQFVEMIERSCRQSVGFLNRFYQSAKYRLAVLDQRLTRVERKLDYIEASLENADVTQRGGKPVPFSGSLFEPESRVDEVRRKLERRRQARGIYTNDIIRPKKTIQKVLTIDSTRGTLGGGAGRGGGQRVPTEQKDPEVSRRQQQPGAGAGRGQPQPGAANRPPPQQPGPPPSGPVPAHARARAAPGGPGRPPQPGGADPGRSAGRRPRAAAAGQPGAPGDGQPRPPSSQPPPESPPSEARPFPHGDPTRIDMQTVQPGQGGIPKKNAQLEVAYTGWLPDGRQFIEHREVVQLGVGQNIAGLEEGLKRMTAGQRCKLWIPCNLAYGPDGAGDLIPPNSDLTFDIKLMRIVG